MFTYSFEALKARLSSKVPELREIDWYMNQDDTKDKNAALRVSPALYLEFNPVTTQDLGRNIQQAECEFNLILLTDCVFDTGSKRLKKDNAKDHMQIFDNVYKAMTGYSAKLSVIPAFAALLNTSDDQRLFNSISRIAITPPHNPRKALMKSIQRFKCMMWDHAALPQYNPPVTPPQLQITPQID